ncbi:MAG: hypothetical protein MZV70_04920 [Desulfobacterales bacterium]|nr:hypothetical protein [Desulfobacterales bacterium]
MSWSEQPTFSSSGFGKASGDFPPHRCPARDVGARGVPPGGSRAKSKYRTTSTGRSGSPALGGKRRLSSSRARESGDPMRGDQLTVRGHPSLAAGCQDFAEDAAAVDATECPEAEVRSRDGGFDRREELSMPPLHLVGEAPAEAPDAIAGGACSPFGEVDERLSVKTLHPSHRRLRRSACAARSSRCSDFCQSGRGLDQLRRPMQRLGIAPESVQVN